VLADSSIDYDGLYLLAQDFMTLLVGSAVKNMELLHSQIVAKRGIQ